MALLITKDVSIMGGLITNQLYLRLSYFMDFSGKSITCEVYPYYSKTAFNSGIANNKLNIPDIRDSYKWDDYDSLQDGDLLTYMHTKIKDDLSTDKFMDVPSVDASTGEYIYDPSTGELVTESVLTKPKFADATEITFIDLD